MKSNTKFEKKQFAKAKKKLGVIGNSEDNIVKSAVAILLYKEEQRQNWKNKLLLIAKVFMLILALTGLVLASDITGFTSILVTNVNASGTVDAAQFTEGGSTTLSNNISGNAATATTAEDTDLLDGSDSTDFMAATLLKDLVAGTALTGGANDVLPGVDGDITISVTADAIGDTQLAFDTGQALTTTSNPTFAGLTSTGDLVLTNAGVGAITTTQTSSYDDSTNVALWDFKTTASSSGYQIGRMRINDSDAWGSGEDDGSVLQLIHSGTVDAACDDCSVLDIVEDDNDELAIAVRQSVKGATTFSVKPDGDTVVTDLTVDGDFNLLPTGIIAMWNGNTSSIPTGWALCDGSPAPDLTGKFIYGSDGTDAGETGGSTTSAHTHTGPSHTHTIAQHSHTVDSHTHSMAHTHTGPSHTHTFSKQEVRIGPDTGDLSTAVSGSMRVSATPTWYTSFYVASSSTGASRFYRTDTPADNTVSPYLQTLNGAATGSEGTGTTSASSAANTGTASATGTSTAGATATGSSGTANTGSTAPSIIPPYYKLAFICKL